ncbi:hypothetical protein LCGC14_0538230 [marine sediment metagenome]|uniref:Uncharacterized protein n=1 Tax=marine sediment metagenome TaxID=412755 RepID=A0A0F9RTQ6_9ZZZZ|nr:hypothetical protein [bacterium]
MKSQLSENEKKTRIKPLPIFIFLFLLVLTPLTFAQQPSPAPQTNVNINVGLQVEFTQVDILENGKDHTFNAHVFNISTGLRLTNSTIDCTYHLFNNTGEHQIDQVPMIFNEFGIDWDFLVLGNNFTRNGEYSYLVVCNTSNIGGFLSREIQVTQDGLITIPFPQQFSIIALGFILIMFGLFQERYNLLKHLGGIILMVMGVLTLYPGYNNISHTTLFGLGLGSILVGIGFWALIEDSFSRTDQEQKFNQDQGSEEEDERN